MPSGFKSKTTLTDLDAVFDSYVTGSKAAAVKFLAKDTGLNLSERYAPYTSGAKAELTGLLTVAGQDLRELYAKIGTTSYLTNTWNNTTLGIMALGSGSVTPPPVEPLIIPQTFGGTGCTVTNAI